MRKLALVSLLLTSCASNPINMPECWEVIGHRGSGSSVPLLQKDGKLWLLTAKHNLPLTMAGKLKIIDQVRHPTLDIALISVRGTARVIRISSNDAELGDKLFAAGYQLRMLMITDGYKAKGKGLMSCPILFGASGGPVWNSDGELVGIIRGVWQMRTLKKDIQVIPHISLYVPVVGLQEWIDKIIG